MKAFGTLAYTKMSLMAPTPQWKRTDVTLDLYASHCFNVSTAINTTFPLQICSFSMFFWFGIYLLYYISYNISHCKDFKLWKSCVSVKCCNVGLYAGVIFMFVFLICDMQTQLKTRWLHAVLQTLGEPILFTDEDFVYFGTVNLLLKDSFICMLYV